MNCRTHLVTHGHRPGARRSPPAPRAAWLQQEMEEPDGAARAWQDTRGTPQAPLQQSGGTASSLQSLHCPGAVGLESKAATSLLEKPNNELGLFSPSLLVLFLP